MPVGAIQGQMAVLWACGRTRGAIDRCHGSIVGGSQILDCGSARALCATANVQCKLQMD